MDDIGKAIVMVGQVLLFITASSVSIFLYSSLTDRAENMLIANTNNNRGDAIVAVEDVEKREVSGAEVVMAILDLKEKSGDSKVTIIGGNGSGTYEYYLYGDMDTIRTPAASYPYKEYDSLDLRNWLISNVANGTYEINNYSSSNTLVYTKK